MDIRVQSSSGSAVVSAPVPVLLPAAAVSSTAVMRRAAQAPTPDLRPSGHKRLHLQYLTPEQLIASGPQRKRGFDLDALTRAGTAARAENASRPYSAQSLGFVAPTTLGPRELLAAIKAMDLRPLQRAGIKPTFNTDFDDTQASGDVFREFTELLLARADFPQHNRQRVGAMLVNASHGAVRKSDVIRLATDEIMAKALGMLKDGKIDQATVFFMMIGALKGMHVAEVEAIADELYEKGAPGHEPYKNHFFVKDGVGAIDLCKAMEAKGIEGHITTLGVPFVARVGARYLGIDPKNVHGSELEVKGGKFTGRALDAGILGKHVLTDNFVSRTPLFCFGDTLGSDAPMLSRATVAAFVVNPRNDFLAHIAKNDADLRLLSYKA